MPRIHGKFLCSTSGVCHPELSYSMASLSLLVLGSIAILWVGGLSAKSSEHVNNGHSLGNDNISGAQRIVSSAGNESAGDPPILKLSDIFIDERDNRSAKEKVSVDLRYETLWSNGSITSTTVAHPPGLSVGKGMIGRRGKLELEGTISGEPEDVLSAAEDTKIDAVFHTKRKSADLKRRIRRLIFPPDDRMRLNTSSTAQHFPFSAVAKTSTGCTATFISPQHVLTSAHCVHDGKQYIVNTSSLKVGFLRRRGRFKWVPALSIRIAMQWKRNKSVLFDYAVVKLKKAHKRQFFTLGVLPTYKRRHLKIHFASFPGDKKANSMWYTRCSARVLSQVLISRCDAFTGSSGSGVYIRIRSRKSDDLRVLVGVLSGSGKVRLPDGRLQPFNFATKLTSLQAEHICKMVDRDFKCISWRPKDTQSFKRRRSKL